MSKARRRSHPSIVRCRPQLELLDTREAPTSLLTGPGSVVGLAALQALAQAGSNHGGGGFVLPVQHQPAIAPATPRHVFLGGTAATPTQHAAPPAHHGTAASPPSTPIRHPIGNVISDPLEPGEVPTGHSQVPPVQANPPGGGGGSGGGGGGGGGGDGGGSAAPPSTPTVPPVSAPAGNAAPSAPAAPPPGGVIHPLLSPGGGAPPASSLPHQQTPASFHAAAQPVSSPPIAFELNEGQAGPALSRYDFLSRGRGYNLFVGPTQSLLSLQGATGQAPEPITLSFAGGNAGASVVPAQQLLYHSNYFMGSQAITDVPNYARVQVTGVYPGIDLHYYGSPAGQLEYDVVVQPGTPLSLVHMQYTGVAHQRTDNAGNLVLTTPGGRTLVQHAPSLYQTAADGARTPITGKFALNGDGTVGFAAGAYDPTRPLVVDPTLDYSTYWGGSGADSAAAVAVDANGSVVMAGQTAALSGTTTDAYVARFDPTGTNLLYVTYFDVALSTTVATGIALDPTGAAYVVGTTAATGFATTSGALQSSGDSIGFNNGFVACLNATGDAELYATYFKDTAPAGVAVDSLGDAFVTGQADSGMATTTGAFQTSLVGAGAAFVAQFSADGSSLNASTFLGPTGSMDSAHGTGIAVDGSGDAFVTGAELTMSSGSTGTFPVTGGAFQTTVTTGFHGFAAELNSAGSGLTWASYLAGSGNDQPNGIAIDAQGNAYIVGTTGSTDYPHTSGAYQTALAGGSDAFVTALSSGGSAAVYSTYLGGAQDEQGTGIAVTADGTAAVTGWTQSGGFPTVNAVPGTAYTSSTEAFLTTFGASGSVLSSSYLGASMMSGSQAAAVALGLDGSAYVAGQAGSGFNVTAGAYQTSYGGGTSDAFVLKVNPNLEAPVITAISPDTGASSSDFITSNPNLFLSGTAPPSVTVELYQDTVPIGTTTSNTSGAWSFDNTATTLDEGVHAFTADSTASGQYSPLSATRLVTIDLSAPALTLTVPASPTTLAPVVSVQASDLGGVADGTTVTLDVDLNNDGNFTDPGETGYATGTLANGYVEIPVVLSAAGTYPVQARVTDQAGNQGTSATGSLIVLTVTVPWTISSAGVAAVDDCGCNTLQQLGGAQQKVPLALDSSAASGQPEPALNYNSNLISPLPIVQAALQSPNNASLPSSLTATLTWNGTAQSPVTFSTTGLHPGDLVTLAVQDTAAVSATGRNDWSLSVTGLGIGTVSASGVTYTRMENSSPAGAGWSFAVNRLVNVPSSGSDPAGWLWLYGTGGERFFQGTSGTLAGPPEENGTLVVNLSGSFTYTAPDGSKLDFNSSGYQTDYVQPDGHASIAYSYTGTQLTGITWLDGSTTTLNYTSGVLTSLVSGTRTWTLTNSGGDLTQIAFPDGRSESFTYASHRLTDVTQGTLVNHWAYNSNGLLNTWRWGNSSSPSTWTLVSANSRGLGTPYAGAANAVETDPNGKVTTYTLTTGGKLLSETTADGATERWTRDSAGRVLTDTDPLGRVTTYTRDSLGYVTQVTLPDSHTQQYTYQSAYHALHTFTDENNHTTTYGYDSLGHLLTITDAASGVITNTFSSSTGLLATSQDPMGRTTTVTWDTSRRVSTITTQLGTTTITYDSATGQLATVTDPLTHTTTLTDDALGRITRMTTADGSGTSWSYDSSGLLARYTDASGIAHWPSYDAFGRGLAATSSAGVPPGMMRPGVTVRTLFSYDNAGQLVAVQDPRGYTTQQTLDALGRPLTLTDPASPSAGSSYAYNLDGELTDATDPAGDHTHYAYNNRGWVSAVTDPRGNVASYGYDPAGNVTQVTDPRGHNWTYTFDTLNRLSTATDPLTHTTTLAYWSDSRLHTVTDPLTHVTSTTYNFSTKTISTTAAYGTSLAQSTTATLNGNGEVTAATDALSHAVTLTLNAIDQVTGVTDALSHTTSRTLDPLGRLKTATDANSHTLTVTRDNLGRPTKTTDATSRTTQTRYDSNDNVVSTLDGLNHSSGTVYDADNRPTSFSDADGNTVQEQYDAAGRPLVLTDARGNRTQWQYDRAGNVIKQVDPNGATVAWIYTADNQVSTRTDELGRREAYSYDNAGRLTTELWKNSSGTTVNTRTYTYNADNQLLTATDASGTYTLTYDTLGRLSTQTDPWSLVLNFGYDAANRLTSVTDSLGGTVTNTYNAADLLTDKKFTDTSSHALSVHYAYDAANEVTLASRYSDATETTLIGTTAYAYDNAGRVTDINHKNGSGTSLDDLTYTYDRAGRVATAASSIGSSQTYTYDPAGQLTGDGTNSWSYDKEGNRTNTGYSTTTGNELSTDGTWNYTYNLTGALIQKTNIATGQVWLYAYDNLNHLVEADHKPSSTGTIDYKEQYTYDVFGNRIGLAVYATGSGTPTITHFAYDPNGNAWADLNSSNALVTRRLYADGVDLLLARIDSSGVAWYLTDLLGSVRDITSSSGALLDHRDYSVWGAITSETHSGYGDRYGFTAREFDTVTGLQYNRKRWYDPSTGRWTSEDPMGFGAGDSNLFRYIENQPPQGTDPSGLEWHHIIIQALWNPDRANPLPFSAAARRIFNLREVGVINAPGHVGAAGHGGYNAAVRAEVNGWLAANRVSPATMTEAEARQLVQYIRNSPIPAIREFFSRILTPAARAGASSAARAAARTTASSAARTAAARSSSRLGSLLSAALGPFSMAIYEVFGNPSATAGAAQLPENTLMPPPGSPEIYTLPLGTIILPSGEIFIPGPGSTYVPPRGSVVVIGRVVGNGLRGTQGLRSGQVAPYPFQDESCDRANPPSSPSPPPHQQ